MTEKRDAAGQTAAELIAGKNCRRPRPLAGELQLGSHKAHEEREDGKKSLTEVLGPLSVVHYDPSELQKAFFSVRFTRKLDASGYARIKHWRVYGEEGLARCEVALWLDNDGLVVEYGGQTLSRYDVSLSSDGTKRSLKDVSNARLFITSYGKTGLSQDSSPWKRCCSVRKDGLKHSG